jgi:hypothetical protein
MLRLKKLCRSNSYLNNSVWKILQIVSFNCQEKAAHTTLYRYFMLHCCRLSATSITVHCPSTYCDYVFLFYRTFALCFVLLFVFWMMFWVQQIIRYLTSKEEKIIEKHINTIDNNNINIIKHNLTSTKINHWLVPTTPKEEIFHFHTYWKRNKKNH